MHTVKSIFVYVCSNLWILQFTFFWSSRVERLTHLVKWIPYLCIVCAIKVFSRTISRRNSKQSSLIHLLYPIPLGQVSQTYFINPSFFRNETYMDSWQHNSHADSIQICHSKVRGLLQEIEHLVGYIFSKRHEKWTLGGIRHRNHNFYKRNKRKNLALAGNWLIKAYKGSWVFLLEMRLRLLLLPAAKRHCHRLATFRNKQDYTIRLLWKTFCSWFSWIVIM